AGGRAVDDRRRRAGERAERVVLGERGGQAVETADPNEGVGIVQTRLQIRRGLRGRRLRRRASCDREHADRNRQDHSPRARQAHTLLRDAIRHRRRQNGRRNVILATHVTDRRSSWLALALFAGLAVLHTWPLATAPASLSRNNNDDTILNEWT